MEIIRTWSIVALAICKVRNLEVVALSAIKMTVMNATN